MSKKLHVKKYASEILGISEASFLSLNPISCSYYINEFKKECKLYNDVELERLKMLPEYHVLYDQQLNKELKKEAVLNQVSQRLLQKWELPSTTKYKIHVGPTNSGKTYHAVQDLKKSKTGLYLCPLRLLAWEIYDKLNTESISCNLRTGEEVIMVDGATITASTIEMCNYKDKHDTVIIDECFMIGDPQRGKSWTKAILEVQADTIHIITNYESLELLKSILIDFNRNFEVVEYTRLVPLEVQKEPFDFKKTKGKTILVCFSRIKTLIQKKLLEEKGHKAAVLYGNLPPDVKKEQIKSFISGDAQFLVATDVISMGLNLPADNVLFIEGYKFDGVEQRELKSIEWKQIGGRAGRYKLSDKGRIYAGEGISPETIKNGLARMDILEKGIIGIDEEMLRLSERRSVKTKLVDMLEMKLDGKLAKHFKKEDLKQYFDLIKYCPQVNILDWELAWQLVSLPVKENNMDYWAKVVAKILADKKIMPPSFKVYNINDTESLKFMEDSISEMELFFYICNRHNLVKLVHVEALEKLEEHKFAVQQAINNINDFLINKKMNNLKKCRDCKKPIGFNSAHERCTDCYNLYRDGEYLDTTNISDRSKKIATDQSKKYNKKRNKKK